MTADHKIEDWIKTWCFALTGGIASGKSTVAAMLRDEGFRVIDADLLSRAVLEPGTDGHTRVLKEFGKGLVGTDGCIDRTALRQLIFNDEAKKKRLEAILHPLIREAFVAEVARIEAELGPTFFFYEAALIVETGQVEQFRGLWVTHCSRDKQIERLMKRSHIAKEFAAKMVDAQFPPAAKAKLATRVIETNGTLDSVREQVRELISELANL